MLRLLQTDENITPYFYYFKHTKNGHLYHELGALFMWTTWYNSQQVSFLYALYKQSKM